MDNTRFGFGSNWNNYIKNLDEKQIKEAKKSLKTYLATVDFQNKSFLDIGCGSGLFSLAAKRLGAKVHSVDYDINSVKCAQKLKSKYYSDCNDWTIEHGDVLNDKYMSNLMIEGYDIVYSWGVLHHTGNMYKAIDNASKCVAKDGIFFISIYNDQGAFSTMWKKIKKFYNNSPLFIKDILAFLYTIRIWGPIILKDLFEGRPFYSWKNYYKLRGMSPWIDIVDWVGGYPFEVAKPKEILDFCSQRGFKLIKMYTCGKGSACNQFVFKKFS